MFAIVKTGGKQYKVRVGETIDVEKLDIEAGDQVELDQVLLAANDGDVAYGRPMISGAVVTARVVRQHKGPKLIVFKYKSKSRYRRRTGHRQNLTQLAIQAIAVPGWATERVEVFQAPAPVIEPAPTPVIEPESAPIEAAAPATVTVDAPAPETVEAADTVEAVVPATVGVETAAPAPVAEDTAAPVAVDDTREAQAWPAVTGIDATATVADSVDEPAADTKTAE